MDSELSYSSSSESESSSSSSRESAAPAAEPLAPSATGCAECNAVRAGHATFKVQVQRLLRRAERRDERFRRKNEALRRERRELQRYLLVLGFGFWVFGLVSLLWKKADPADPFSFIILKKNIDL
jgi:hypothetical protein